MAPMQNPETAPPTVLERLKQAIESASAHNPNDAEAPVAILWVDQESRWQPILPQLRRLMPQLLTFGDFKPEERSGPAVWLRYEIDCAGSSSDTTDTIPVIYLPGVSRQVLGTADTCPKHLKPLVELQYRGLCWMQKNGRDWTVEAFLSSSNGGLGLDLAQDNATRQSMQWALSELAATSVQALAGRRLEAEDFDRLFSDDPARDLLAWLNDPKGVQAGWGAGRWQAFVSRCKQDFGLDPERDGEVVAAERLGEREGPWHAVWRRFAEAPALHPNLPALLRRAMPLLPLHASSWPQRNEQDEDALRKALFELGSKAPAIARKELLELEKVQGIRRDWAWAALGQAPLAQALQPLAELAERTASELGGASPNDMARLYVDGAWRVDDAALRSYAAVKTAADSKAIAAALNAIYRPWLDAAARHLQALAENQPLPNGKQLALAKTSISKTKGQPHLGVKRPKEREALEGVAGDDRMQRVPVAKQLAEHEAPRQMAGDEGMQVIPSIEHLAEANAAIEPGTLMLFADGLRFDVAQRLISRLQANGRAVQASIRWAGLPTVTATAKPAVSPVAAQIVGNTLGEDFLPIAADTQKPLTTDRFRKLLAAEGFECLNAAETGDPSGRAWTETGELDKLGHSLQAKLAASIDEQVNLLAERIESLLRVGWREVRLVTDHGWLWLPGGLPKADLPKYLTQSRWARCAAIKGSSRVEAPTVPWHWNAQERVAIGPGIACFTTGNEYAHGGLSLQEAVVPVLRVGVGAGGRAKQAQIHIAAVSWIGLRCRVRIKPAMPGLSVELRTQVADAASSISQPRPVENDGAAGLLVANGDLEGASAAIVVLNTQGEVLAKQSTIIGGEN